MTSWLKWMIGQRRYMRRIWSYSSVVSWLLFMTCKFLRQSVVSVSSPLIGWRDSTGVCWNSLEEKSFEGGWVVRLMISNYSSKGFKLFIQGFQTIHPRIPFLNNWPADSEGCKYLVYQNHCGESRMGIPFQMSIFPESLIFPSLPFLGRIRYFYHFLPENVNFRGQYLKKMKLISNKLSICKFLYLTRI